MDARRCRRLLSRTAELARSLTGAPPADVDAEPAGGAGATALLDFGDVVSRSVVDGPLGAVGSR